MYFIKVDRTLVRVVKSVIIKAFVTQCSPIDTACTGRTICYLVRVRSICKFGYEPNNSICSSTNHNITDQIFIYGIHKELPRTY